MSYPHLSAGYLLAGRYEIVREIGRGGMATVHLANDRKHGRTVAIKVLLAELSKAIGAERFTREIRTVARLTHPHILPLYDSGDEDGVLFFVMPYVDGESLRELLDREGSTDLAQAATIVRHVGEALDFAHAHGVVHRDVKPENIMLVAGQALLSDFGIARAFSEDEVQTLTTAGATLGTPFYMSPEQASGERNIDGRSDLYALGCIAFEMLGGARPFEGMNPMATMAQHVTKPAPRLVGMRASLPNSVIAAVNGMLNKEPDDRFQAASPFALILESAANGSGVQVNEIVQAGDPSREAITKVLVFDFSNISAASDLDWLTVGIAETISADLRRIKGIRVVGGDLPTRRRMSDALKGATAVDAATARRLGKSVGARWVVAGGFQRAGARLRLIPQFFDVDSGEAVNTAKIDGSMDEIFELQDRVVTQFAATLNIDLTTSEAALIAKPETARMQAYELYARGRQAALTFGKESTRIADDYFRRAIAIDPQYALAWAGLGGLLMPRLLTTGDFSGLDDAVYALKRAQELDPALSEPHIYLAYLYLGSHRWDEGIACARTAVEQDAGVPLSWYLLGAGIWSRAIETKSPSQLALAIPPALRARAVSPDFQPASLVLAAMYMMRGDYAYATQFAVEAVDIEASGEGLQFVGSYVIRAFIHLHSDERSTARELFAFAIERYTGADHVYAETVTAWAHFGLGRLAERDDDLVAATRLYEQSVDLANRNAHRAGIGSSWVKATLGLARMAHARGHREDSRTLLDEAMAMIETRSRFLWNNFPGASLADNWYEVGATYAGAGERNQALAALQRAADHGWADRHQLHGDSLFSSLRADPRLAQLVERAKAMVTLPPPTGRGGLPPISQTSD